jgi:serine/threonine protein kinase
MLLDSETFHRAFEYTEFVNMGSDGTVSKWTHRRIPTRMVAVKIPHAEARTSRHREQMRALRKEIAVLTPLSCNNIVSLMGWEWEWDAIPDNPALYYEYCEFGDVCDFSGNLLDKYKMIPEETVWKLFADMSRGFYHLHVEQNPPLVHGDFKTGNILVARPESGHSGDCPILPTFKIADFGRSRQYIPGEQRNSKNKWEGTYEFAPPPAEVAATPPTPAMDIFSLGAVLQAFALNVVPVQTRAAFMADYLQQTGVDLMTADPPVDWHEQRWRKLIPVKYRPLNVTSTTMRRLWDWDKDRPDPQQFSNQLNRWYRLCWAQDSQKRITAKYLYKYLIPVAQQRIKSLQKKSQFAQSILDLEAVQREAAEFEEGVHAWDSMSPQREQPPLIPLKAPRRQGRPPPLPPRPQNWAGKYSSSQPPPGAEQPAHSCLV